jgi:molybdopterin-guanine dinucleotide biosynthesis protein A
MRVGGVIIAGGQSRRMGADKLTLLLEGKRIIDHVIDRVAPQVDALVINANEAVDRFAGHRVIPDLRATGTPLAGVHAGLSWGAAKGFTHVLTTSGDTPFLPADLRTRLSLHNAAIAESHGQQHYLIGLWPVAALPLLTENLFRVQDWAAKLGATPVHWDGDPFFNINTPEDLIEAARKSAI